MTAFATEDSYAVLEKNTWWTGLHSSSQLHSFGWLLLLLLLLMLFERPALG